MRNHVTLYHTYINQDLFSAVTVSLTCSRTFSTSICDQQPCLLIARLTLRWKVLAISIYHCRLLPGEGSSLP